MKLQSPIAELPERFNVLESMLFAPVPGYATEAAKRYANDRLSRPVAPPATAPALRIRPSLTFDF